MTKTKCFSFDLFGRFAFFNNGEFSNCVKASFDIIPKMNLYGIFGAILGLGGYVRSKVLPEYYVELKEIKIAIQPHYTKPLHKIKNISIDSTGLSSTEPGGILVYPELILYGHPEIRYTIYVLETDKTYSKKTMTHISELKSMIKKSYTKHYLYFGKNEFPAYMENFKPYTLTKKKVKKFKCDSLCDVSTVDFFPKQTKKTDVLDVAFLLDNTGSAQSSFFIVDLPVQYTANNFFKKKTFCFTNTDVYCNDATDIYMIPTKNKYIQFF